MSSVLIPIREVKEPVDSGRPYLKPSTKEKGKKSKSQKSAKAERREKASAKEGMPREER